MYAQEIGETAGYEYADSVIFRPACAVDSTLVGIDIFDAMPSRAAGDKAGVGNQPVTGNHSLNEGTYSIKFLKKHKRIPCEDIL